MMALDCSPESFFAQVVTTCDPQGSFREVVE